MVAYILVLCNTDIWPYHAEADLSVQHESENYRLKVHKERVEDRVKEGSVGREGDIESAEIAFTRR